MLWCPKCGEEYMDGTEACADCGAELVQKSYRDLCVVATAFDDMEAGMLLGMLEGNGIQAMKSPQRGDGYLSVLLGNNRGGVDIYVPEDQLEAAQKLIDANREAGVDEDEPADEYDGEEDPDEEPDPDELAGIAPRKQASALLLFGLPLVILAMAVIVYLAVK